MEAILGLVPFILVILGIISFIDILRFMIRSSMPCIRWEMKSQRIHIFYEALGIRSADLGLKADIDKQTAPLDTTLNDLSSFLEQVGQFEDDLNGIKVIHHPFPEPLNPERIRSIRTAAGKLWGVFISDPKQLLRSIVYLGIEKGEQKAKRGFSDVFLERHVSGLSG